MSPTEYFNSMEIVLKNDTMRCMRFSQTAFQPQR